MSLLQDGWDAALSAWAHSQGDIHALVQIGSRVQKGTAVDFWSDYDYQLITTRPGKYRDGSFARQISPCWACGKQPAFGNVTKIIAVYDGALEADFVVLRHWEMIIATLALRWPSTSWCWPRVLEAGVNDLRGVAAPGWKVIKGGRLWEDRYSRITQYNSPITPQSAALTERTFTELCGEFWTQLVWAAKKAERGEFLASQRTIHLYLIERCLRIYEEEAILNGRQSYPRGRRAETWLTAEQLKTRNIGTRPDRTALITALDQISEEFAKASAAVAEKNNWQCQTYSEVREWLSGLTGPAKS